MPLHPPMKFHQPATDLFIPDRHSEEEAFARITHLGVGAHQDDLEFMAFDGILRCFGSRDEWFGGVTCTNGGGSARCGAYAAFTDDQMMEVRREEQRKAATVGGYGVMIQLDYPSSVVKDARDPRLKEDLKEIVMATTPRHIYTHNPADKHDTHVAVVVALIQALREIPGEMRPQAVHGCEVWRNLDWMPDNEKVVHDVSGHANLAAALNGIFDSQIAGGKRYDLAVAGRRSANASFFESHGVDRSDSLSFAMDLTPLIRNEALDILDYVVGFIDRFRSDVIARLGKRLGR